MYDLLIKGGRVIDGSGADAVTADVAIRHGRIVEVGKLSGAARRTLDADGLLVTPGFVDIHTHYDGQATWDPLLSPSFHNGVTTVVMGNCGVGFAPAREDKRRWLIGLMEGVEEIPGTALHDGIRWNWESFPEFLNALEAMPRALDVAALIAHGPVRAYVMGQRCELEDPATDEDVKAMATLVREAVEAGAFGFSSSRTYYHRSVDGVLVPGTFADENELVAIGRAIRAAGHGIMQVVPLGVAGDCPDGHLAEVQFLRRVARKAGVEVQFLLGQYNEIPGNWREMLREADEARAEGVTMTPLVFGRGTGVLFSFQSTNPFSRYPTYVELMKLPNDQRIAALKSPEIKAKILAETDPIDDEWKRLSENPWPYSYVMGEQVNYEPDPSESIEAIARRMGKSPKEVGYDELLKNDGRAFLSFPLLGYSGSDLEAVREMIEHPLAVLSGSDAGAHCNTICDGAVASFMLTHWTRDRKRGPKMRLETVVAKQTSHTAKAIGMHDRGLLRPGYIADVNLIDYENLRVLAPEYVTDLPSGCGRLTQKATGYVATVKTGTVISTNGEDTGERPGTLVRGGRTAIQIAAE
jgi:N-acyl-D-aspartate/D-glutamate deacylase